MLTDEQKAKLLQQCKLYLKAPQVINQGEVQDYRVFDEKRASAIPPLKALIVELLQGKTSLVDFKESSERLCRQYPYWGFKNFSGQMQLNKYVNNVVDERREEVLKSSIVVPRNETEAKDKIDALRDFLASQKASAEIPKTLPRLAQYYFLSYFWELQEPNEWPVYYGSSRKVLLNLGFQLDRSSSAGSEYLLFLHIMRDVSSLFETEHKSKYPFWFVEHVLWTLFMQATPDAGDPDPTKKTKGGKKADGDTSLTLFGEWIPEIVRDLNDLAHNKETSWSKREELKPEKAFETKLAHAFTLLGYETEELGQGTGREPDGVALSVGVFDGDYAIVYDAKARESRFSIGTSDREIHEYIQKKRDLLRRRNRINKLYYVIVSSEFDDRSQEALLGIYKRTHVPITLLKAADLLLIIDTKLQNVEINHAKLEDLFLETGIISREKVIDILGVR